LAIAGHYCSHLQCVNIHTYNNPSLGSYSYAYLLLPVKSANLQQTENI